MLSILQRSLSIVDASASERPRGYIVFEEKQKSHYYLAHQNQPLAYHVI